MATNPVQIQIPGDTNGSITCNAHAAYFQRVTLTISNLGNPIVVVFSGSGEGVPMTTQDGSTNYPIGSRQSFTISALFEYSQTGPNGPFQQSYVQDPMISSSGNDTFITVTSEDSTDGDNNDSYLIIFYQSL